MENSKTELRVKGIIAKLSGQEIEKFIQENDNSTNVKQELNIDSLDEVEIVMDLEKEFGIEIPDLEAEKLETIQDYIDIVERLATEEIEVDLDNENTTENVQ